MEGEGVRHRSGGRHRVRRREHAAFIVQTTNGHEAGSLVYPFRAEGPLFDAPIRVPTQLDLPGTPRPCTAGNRAATPRVVAPYQNGTRHPVIVTDAVEPLRVLLSNDAVVHGTPEAPCAAAYEAELVASEGAPIGQQEHALVLADPAERSYLFRTAQGSASFEFRGMSCRMDPAARDPPGNPNPRRNPYRGSLSMRFFAKGAASSTMSGPAW